MNLNPGLLFILSTSEHYFKYFVGLFFLFRFSATDLKHFSFLRPPQIQFHLISRMMKLKKNLTVVYQLSHSLMNSKVNEKYIGDKLWLHTLELTMVELDG